MAKGKKSAKKNKKAARTPAAQAPEKKKAETRPAAVVSGKKEPPKKAVVRREEKGPNFLVRTRQFFREVRIELKKVTWPARKETLASTSVVIILVFLVAVFLGLVDAGLSRILKLVLR